MMVIVDFWTSGKVYSLFKNTPWDFGAGVPCNRCAEDVEAQQLVGLRAGYARYFFQSLKKKPIALLI